MTAPSSRRDEVLERWCVACAAKLKELKGIDRPWKAGEGIYWFPCPNVDGDHEWKGDDTQGWAYIKEGLVRAGCRKCAPKDSDLGEAYTEKVKELLGWEEEDGSVYQRGKDFTVLREHVFGVVDGRFEVRMQKVKVGRRAPTFWYQLRDVDPGRKGFLAPAWRALKNPTEWAQAVYPVLGSINSVIRLYHHDDFFADGELRGIYQVAICEGPKDADSLRDLLSTIPGCPILTTSLMAPLVKALAPHQEALFRGRHCKIIPDGDDGGDAFKKRWSGLLHPIAQDVKILDARELFGEGKDLSDWIEAGRAAGRPLRQMAEEFLAALSATAPQAEPLETPNAWRARLKQGEKGVLKTSLHNAKVVWTEHPDLIGKVRLNMRSGDVEVVDPPWSKSGLTVGARRVAATCAAWLEDACEVSLSQEALADALHIDGVTIPHNPLGSLLEEHWDGVPRLDGLFTHYLPLEAPPGVAVRLARIFMSDLVAKLDGRLRAQTLMIGICTGFPADVAGALLGRHGVHHRGKVDVRQVLQFARDEAGLVQISPEPVVDSAMARGSIAHLFASDLMQSHGRISTPLFLAVGSVESSLADKVESRLDERCLLVATAGALKIDALAADSVQLIAEAVARRVELDLVPIVTKAELKTVDEMAVDENLLTMLSMIHAYDRFEIDHPEVVRRYALAPASVALRSKRLEFIIRDRFINVWREQLAPHWRSERDQIKIFNMACRALGLTEGKHVRITMTRGQAVGIGHVFSDPNGETEHVPGARIRSSQSEALGAVLNEWEIRHLSPDLPNPSPMKNSRETGGLPNLPNAPEFPDIGVVIAKDSPACAYAYTCGKGKNEGANYTNEQENLENELIGTVASVPFMITATMKEQLREFGYTEDQIREMTPEQAHSAIAAAQAVLE